MTIDISKDYVKKRLISEDKALKFIEEDKWKKQVYETFLRNDPDLADKYLMAVRADPKGRRYNWIVEENIFR